MFENQTPSTQLTLRRKRQFMEANMPVDILVNGHLACQLKNGETQTVNIYTTDPIQLQADLMRSKTGATAVSAAERAQYIYEISHVISNPVYCIGVLLAIASSVLIITTGHLAWMALVAPPAGMLLYFKFIRRERYLRINKIPDPQPNTPPDNASNP